MRIFAGIVLALAPLWVLALEVGERLTPWTLLDQHEQAYSLNEETRVLLIARSMDGARLVEAVLKTRPQGYLEARRAVFVADISRMPSLVARLFAVPAMRDYPYRVLLDRDARVASRYPGDPAKVLWLDLEHGRLRAMREFADAGTLVEALEQAAR
ncbi:FAD/FMN-containing dehydrogenase [Azorhizophilus paspali]|uniref:FAD/FMN-containing dehydrogenase n=1 Tax=Azorhizophilus paspali TaxID=69963 RepID=A0ABV6SL06_AZOPA